MDLKELLHSVAKEEKSAIKELYDTYSVPFYFTALSVVKDDKVAKNAAVEAFRRIICNAYKFDEELNAQYWLFDVLYTLCVNKVIKNNKMIEEAVTNYNIPDDIVTNTASYIKIFTDLEANEIASIMRCKKSQVSKKIIDSSKWGKIKELAPEYCPDYYDEILSKNETSFENISEKERTLTEKVKNTQKKFNYVKRIIVVVLIVSFFASAALIIKQLVTKNFGSDIDQNLLGEEIYLQFRNKIACTEMDGDVYFCGENNKLYRRDMKTNQNICISEDYPKELINDGEFIYYRNYIDGYMYKINSDGTGRTRLCDVPGTSMAYYDGRIYFSASGGIYSVSSKGDTFENAKLVLDTSADINLYCVDMDIDSSGNVFFAGGIGGGVHHVTEFNSAPSVEGIFSEEVYNICIDNDLLYFDCKDASGKILLYCFDIKAHLENETSTRIMPTVVSDSKGNNIILSTGAFSVKNNKIFYCEDKEGASVICMLDENKVKSEITDIPDKNSYKKDNVYITYIYVSDNMIYSYCSDGKEKGERVFFCTEIETKDNIVIFVED